MITDAGREALATRRVIGRARRRRKPVITDNSDEGLYGLDAVLTYTASASGCLDPLATAYQFEVVPT